MSLLHEMQNLQSQIFKYYLSHYQNELLKLIAYNVSFIKSD